MRIIFQNILGSSQYFATFAILSPRCPKKGEQMSFDVEILLLIIKIKSDEC